jgi:small subunit ribosomal protein SAe
MQTEMQILTYQLWLFVLLQPIREAALGNIPVIAFCDTDSPMRHVDISIPANNKGKHSIGCLFWLLGRMVLQMRGTITPSQPWDVMVII